MTVQDATCGLIANYVVCFGLDICRFPGRPHLLLFGFLGMVACLIVAPVASRWGKVKNAYSGHDE